MKKENTPTGISVDYLDGSVTVVGLSIDGSGTAYRYDYFYQCLPPAMRLAQNTTEQSIAPSAVEFYPNPSDGNITVVMNNQTSGILELFNLEGQLVFTQQIKQSGKINLPVNQVPNGVYLLKFTGDAEIQFNKLIIQRNN